MRKFCLALLCVGVLVMVLGAGSLSASRRVVLLEQGANVGCG